MGTAVCLTDSMFKPVYATPAYVDDTCWFRGLGDALMTTPAMQPVHEAKAMQETCVSAPYVGLDGYLYFQGQRNKLTKMSSQWPYLHGDLGDLTCTAPPIAPADGYVYFLGDGNRLMRANTVDPTDNADYAIVCATTPAIALHANKSLFYSETGGTIRRIGIEHGRKPGEGDIIGNFKCTQPLLACVDGYLYFEVDKTLHRYKMSDAAKHDSLALNHHVKGGLKAFDFPFDKRVYYMADDGKLYGLTVDPWPTAAPITALCNVKMASPPCPGPPGYLLCQGADNKLYRVPTT